MPSRERRARALGVSVDQLPPSGIGKHSNHARGPANGRWKGGHRAEAEYIKVSSVGGIRRYEHRIVAEKKLGRPLATGEVVHHLNGDRRDNRESNIEVLTSQSDHARIHNAERPRDEHGRFAG